MKIELKKITLNNFRGIYQFEQEFEGSTNILGANESGKSTIYTAFCWLLTGKNELDKEDFDIKNTKQTDLNRNPHEVEATFLVDGSETRTFKRVYLEEWVRPKGEEQEVFKGNKVEYWYNGVKCRTQKEYQDRVNELIPDNVIKLITNPAYFNSMKWDLQRNVLTMIVGTISRDEILNAIATPENDFGELIAALNNKKTADQFKKEVAAKKLDLKKKAVEFKPRIEEVRGLIPAAEDWDALQRSLNQLEAEQKDIDARLSDSSLMLQGKQKDLNDKCMSVFTKEQRIAAIRNGIKNTQIAKQNEGTGEIDAIRSQFNTVKGDIARLDKEIAGKKDNIAGYNTEINRLTDIISGLREKWKLANAEVFSFDESKCECPTCKQPLPLEKVEKSRADMEANFNNDVAKRKDELVAQSDKRKAEITTQQGYISIATTDIEILQANLSAEEAKLSALQEKITQLVQAQTNKKPVEDIEIVTDALLKLNEEALNLQDEIVILQNEIEEDRKQLNAEGSTEAEKARRMEVVKEMDDLKQRLSVKKNIEASETRIRQLLKEEAANSQALADLERQEFQAESYTRAQMDILQQRVNGMFKYVTFRMFNKLANGGTEETCVCEYKEVPYKELNTAAKLLAGLDVLNTLSNFYNIHAPVFCDNRESVTWIPEIGSQIISLFVSPPDKVLRIEAA